MPLFQYQARAVPLGPPAPAGGTGDGTGLDWHAQPGEPNRVPSAIGGSYVAGLGGGSAAGAATKTFNFAADAENLADGGQTASIAFGFVADGAAGDGGAVRFTSSTGSLASVQESAFNATTPSGETWQSWGVPAGATVTSVQVSAWQQRTAAFTNGTSHTITVQVIDDSGSGVTTIPSVSTVALSTGVSASYSAGATGTSQAVLSGSQPAATGVRLKLIYALTTASAPTIDWRVDNLTLTISFTSTDGGWTAGVPQPIRTVRYALGTPTVAPGDPGAGALPEAITADRWQPRFPQPSRAPRYAAGTDAALAPAGVGSAQPDRWAPRYPQPDRTPRYATGTVQVVPPSTAAESTSLDRWAAVWPSPSRAIRYAAGDSRAAPVSTLPEGTSADRWAALWQQPSRATRYAAGDPHSEPVSTAPEATGADRWAAIFAQPSRATRYAVGTTSAAPTLAVEPITADRWQPTVVQPSRAIRAAAGTDSVGSLVVVAAAEPVTVDRWAPTSAQPGRAPRPTAGSSTTVVTTAPETVSLDRWAPSYVQPDRSPRRYAGSAVVVVSTAAEVVTPDRWQPTVVHPDRAVRYARGTETVGSALPLPNPPAPSCDWYQAQPQPDRTPRLRPAGSTVVPPSVAAEATSADRWAATYAQPDRSPHYARGTVHTGSPLPIVPATSVIDAATYLLLLGGPSTPPAPPPVTPSVIDAATYLLLVGVAGGPPPPPPPTPAVIDAATYLLLVGVAGTPPLPPPSTVVVPDAAWWFTFPPTSVGGSGGLTGSIPPGPGSAAPDCTAFLADDFLGSAGSDLANHAADVGGQWSNNQFWTGSAALDGRGGIFSTSNGLTVFVNAATPPGGGNPDAEAGGYRIEADLQIYSLVGRAGLVLDSDQITRSHYWGYYDADARRWAIARNGVDLVAVPAATLTAANAAVPTPAVGGAYRLQFWNSGGRLSLLVNDIIILTIEDHGVTQVGLAGVGFVGVAGESEGLHLARLHACSLMVVPTELGDLLESLARLPVDARLLPSAVPRVGGTQSDSVGLAVVIDPLRQFPAGPDPFGMLEIGTQAPLPGQVDGAGRYLSGFKGKFTYHVVGRSRRDIAGTDTLRITLASVGLARLAQAVMDALQVLMPTDRWGNCIVQCPIRTPGQVSPRFYATDARQVDWAGFAVEFEVEYYLKLTAGRALT